MGIKLGMVGLGAFGRGFANLFMSHPLVDSIALCDREPERIKAFMDLDFWQAKLNHDACGTSYEDMLRTDVDAIVIITQPWLHAPQCIQALEAGKSVYSAVPIISVPDGDEILDWCSKLVDAVKRSGRHYMLGETTYYRPQAMYARKRAAEGAFGEFTYSQGEYFHDFRDLYKVRERRTNSSSGREWLEREKAYDARGCVMSPMFYPTHSVAGPICVTKTHAVKACCFGQRPFEGEDYFGDDPRRFSNTTALFQMSNGGAMRIIEHREASISREMFSIYGTQGTFEGSEAHEGGHNLWIKGHTPTPLSVDEMRDPLPPDVAKAWEGETFQSSYGGHGGSHPYLVHEFVESVAQERPPAINIWEACRYMTPGVAAHQSAQRGGELVDVVDFGDAPE
jgi:predicted dehydrogenase